MFLNAFKRDVIYFVNQSCLTSSARLANQTRNLKDPNIRAIATSTAMSHTAANQPLTHENSIELTFIGGEGERTTVRAAIGSSLMQAAHANDVELEGACEGSLACSTCHVILSESVFETLPEACDDENDMLDLAYGLTETSRLGCQVICEHGALDRCEVKIPSASRNFAVDGFKPKPH
jgi:ferredoxin-2, mitochondrial